MQEPYNMTVDAYCGFRQS